MREHNAGKIASTYEKGGVWRNSQGPQCGEVVVHHATKAMIQTMHGHAYDELETPLTPIRMMAPMYWQLIGISRKLCSPY